MNIPAWLGPIVGVALGTVLYWRVVKKAEEEVDTGMLIAFGVVGFVAGCLIWIVDARRKRKEPRVTSGR